MKARIVSDLFCTPRPSKVPATQELLNIYLHNKQNSTGTNHSFISFPSCNEVENKQFLILSIILLVTGCPMLKIGQLIFHHRCFSRNESGLSLVDSPKYLERILVFLIEIEMSEI